MEMEQKPKTDDRQDEHEEEAEGERHVTAMQKFVGFVMLVLGWLQLLLAVSSGSEATSVPFLIYFAGVVIFVSGTATRWEKEVVVYGTIVVAAYFILFAKKQVRRINLPPSPPQPPTAPPQE